MRRRPESTPFVTSVEQLLDMLDALPLDEAARARLLAAICAVVDSRVAEVRRGATAMMDAALEELGGRPALHRRVAARLEREAHVQRRLISITDGDLRRVVDGR